MGGGGWLRELYVLFIFEGTEIIHIFFYQRLDMFSLCGIFKSRKDHIDRKSPHYDDIQKARKVGFNAVSE